MKYSNLYFHSINFERTINVLKKLQNLLLVTYREMIGITWKVNTHIRTYSFFDMVNNKLHDSTLVVVLIELFFH